MQELLVKIISQIIKDCQQTDILDFEFYIPPTNLEYQSCWFEILRTEEKNYSITINNGKVHLAEDDIDIILIDEEDSKKWNDLADEMFKNTYEDREDDSDLDLADLRNIQDTERRLFNE